MTGDDFDEGSEDVEEFDDGDADDVADGEGDENGGAAGAAGGANHPGGARKNYITAPGLAVLKAEYQKLFHDERPKLVETVAWAASNGDRSENGDYIYGKRRLREIDRRLKFLGRRMQNAVVVNPATQPKDQVQFGARVTVEDEDEKKLVYRIVGEDEIDIERRKISWVSPVAKALIGAKRGDVVTVRRPNGEIDLTIVKIEYPEADE